MYPGFVIGLDVSLTSTGMAAVNARGEAFTTVVRSTGSTTDTVVQTARRIESLAEDICDQTVGASPALVVIESAFFSTRKDTSAHRRAGLWWAILAKLIDRDVTVVPASPAQVKKYATGKGNASKEQVLVRVATDWGADVLEDGRNDRADALVLAAMGAHYLGGALPFTTTAYRTAVVDEVFSVLDMSSTDQPIYATL